MAAKMKNRHPDIDEYMDRLLDVAVFVDAIGRSGKSFASAEQEEGQWWVRIRELAVYKKMKSFRHAVDFLIGHGAIRLQVYNFIPSPGKRAKNNERRKRRRAAC